MGCDDSQTLTRAPGRDRPRGVEHALRGPRALYSGATALWAPKRGREDGGSRLLIRISIDLGGRAWGDGVEPRSHRDENPGVRVQPTAGSSRRALPRRRRPDGGEIRSLF